MRPKILKVRLTFPLLVDFLGDFWKYLFLKKKIFEKKIGGRKISREVFLFQEEEDFMIYFLRGRQKT